MAVTEEILIDHPADGVGRITMNRPERRNALSDAAISHGLAAAFESVSREPSVRAIILTGAGGAFTAGADLSDSGAASVDDPLLAAERMRASHRVLYLIRAAAQPVIAAIEGPAVGAGLGLAAACDIQIAAPNARFSAPYASIGIPPDFGVSYFVPRLIGYSRALEVLLSGRTVDGVEAHAIGLVARLAEDPQAAALELAAALSALPPGAVAQTKRNVAKGLEVDLDTGIDAVEIQSVALALAGSEFRTALRAWKERFGGSGQGSSPG